MSSQLQRIAIRFPVTSFSIPAPIGGTAIILEPNPMRYAVGFCCDTKGTGVMVGINNTTSATEGIMVETDIKWFDVPKFGPLPMQQWYAVATIGNPNITIFEVIDTGRS